jgi:hypothetical protein
MRFDRALPTAALILAAASSRAAAQRTSAQLMVGGGTATDVRGISSSAVMLAPSLAIVSTGSAFRVGLSGTSFGGGGWAAGGSSALDLRFPIAPLAALTLGGAVGGTFTSYYSSHTSLSATPALELRLAPLALFGGVRSATGRSSVGASAPAAGLLAPPATRPMSRSSTGPVFGGRLALASTGSSVILAYRQEQTRIDSAPATDRTATVSVVRGPLLLTGILGARSERAATTTFGGVRASVALSRILALQVGAERYPGDLLTGTVGGRAVSAGLVLRTASGPRPLPRPSGVAGPAAGRTRLSIRAPSAGIVEVAGDWNGWRPVPAHRGDNGVWYADLAIPTGTWRYGFRIDRREWRVPDGTTATEDGFGGKSAWLTVDSIPK